MSNLKLITAAALAASLLLAACAAPTPTAVPTATVAPATPTVAPSATSAPSATPAATATAVPSATSEPPTATAVPSATAAPATSTLLPTSPAEAIATLATRTVPLTDLTWDYVALGDSNPAGFGVEQSYVPLYAADLALDLRVEVRVTNAASDGATSGTVLHGLQTNSDLQQAIRDAEVVTVDVGGNDWGTAVNDVQAHTCGGSDNQNCLRQLLNTFRDNYAGLLTEIATLKGDAPGFLLRTVDLYTTYGDIFAGLKNADTFAVVEPYVVQFNALIEQLTLDHHGAVVHLNLALNGPAGDANPKPYLQPDQAHLNPTGHQALADLLRMLGY